MGAAAYNRGTRAIMRQADADVAAANKTADRRAHADERKRLLQRISDLEAKFRKSERARIGLRCQLTMERESHEATKRSSAFSTKCLLGALARLDPKTWGEE